LPGQEQRTDLPRAALYMASAGLLFAAMGVGIKLVSTELSNSMVVFFRNAVSVPVLLPWLLLQGRSGFRTRDLTGHVIRGLGGLLAMYCFFYAIAHLRLADAILLNQSVPLFLPLVGRVWLDEPVPEGLWRVLAVGFAGLVLVLRPGSSLFATASLVGLLSAAIGAVAQVSIRRLTRTEPPARIVFYFALIGALGAAPGTWMTWHTPAPRTWAILLVIGLLGALGQLAMTRAYANAPAAQVGPFIFVGPVLAGLFDWWLWSLPPDPLFVIGAVLVVAAAVLTLRLAPVREIVALD
jgi:drug/metabolite transporter (DMT)-like permease